MSTRRIALTMILLLASITPSATSRVEAVLPEPPPPFIEEWPLPNVGIPAHVGICADFSGHIFVAWGSLLLKYSTSGTLLSSYSVTSPPTQVPSAADVAIDNTGKIYFVCEHTDQVFKLNADWSLVTTWGIHGSGVGQWWQAHSIATDGTTAFYLLDWGNNRLYSYTLDGTMN